MFSKSIVAAAVSLALAVQVSAHACVAPRFDQAGGTCPSRDKVARIGKNTCGGINIPNNLNTATPIAADANGVISVQAQNYNGGVDGSLQFTADVDPSCTGKNFVPMTITTNGQKAPSGGGQKATIVAQLPAGMRCTGGTSGNLCLVSMRNADSFGNCIIVQQQATVVSNAVANAQGAGAATANSAANAANGASAIAGSQATAQGGAAQANAQANAVGGGNAVANAVASSIGAAPAVVAPVIAPIVAPPLPPNYLGTRALNERRFVAAGTRAARALRRAATSEERDEIFGARKRGLASWIWA